MTYGLREQCDPRALVLWNNMASGAPLSAELMGILRSDFPTFCALLLKVRPKGGGMIAALIFNQVQRVIWATMQRLMKEGKPLFLVILKFRQAGMSTFWDAWIFWQCWRQHDIQTMIIAHQLPTAELMIETMRVFYDELPDVFKPKLRAGNHGATIPRDELYFSDRRASAVIHLAKNVDPRGAQVTHVLETEHASYDYPEELNGALLPQLPPMGSEAFLRCSFVIESTPKGQNHFYEMYHNSKLGKTMWTSIFVPWFIFDEQYAETPPPGFKLEKLKRGEYGEIIDDEPAIFRDLSRIRKADYDGQPITLAQMYWRRQMIDGYYNGNLDVFDQEYPSDDTTCFLLASKSVFRKYARYLEACVRQNTDRAIKYWADQLWQGKPIQTSGPLRAKLVYEVEEVGNFLKFGTVSFEPHGHGKWLLWELPQPGHAYTVGLDPALGFDTSDNSVGQVFDVTTGRQVAEFADQVSPEHLADEGAAAGYFYNNAMLVPEINNVGYVTLKRLLGQIAYPNMYRWPKFDEVNAYTKKRGWETNSRTKMLMISALKLYFEEQQIEIASKELLSECSTFEQKGDSMEPHFAAQKGRRDDRLMGYGLAIMGADQTPKLHNLLNRSDRKMPTAFELGIAAVGPSALPTPTPIPKAIAEQIGMKHNIPWNPFHSEMPF